MKRIKWIMIILIPFLMTGCTSKLKCNIETNNYKSYLTVKFNKKGPTKYKYKDEAYFDSLDTNSEIYLNEKLAKYSDLVAEKKARISEWRDTVTIKINYDFEKDQSQGEKLLLVKKNDTKEIVKEKMKKRGYKCN